MERLKKWLVIVGGKGRGKGYRKGDKSEDGAWHKEVKSEKSHFLTSTNLAMETRFLQCCVCPLLPRGPLRCPISLHQCRACDDCRVTSVSVKPGFECCCFHSKVSSCCFKFLYFIYIYFFSSQKSLHNSQCLVRLMFIFSLM